LACPIPTPLALLSSDWTPLVIYPLRFHLQASGGLRLPRGASPSTGLVYFKGLHPLETPWGNVPHALSQLGFFIKPLGLYHPGPTPGCLFYCGLAPGLK
jgi:hypothetical protein